MSPHPDPRALPALLFGALLIGLAPVLVRLSETGPTATAFWRLALAIPLLAALHAGTHTSGGDPVKPRWWIAAGIFFALDLGVWHQSIRLTSVANATLLTNLAPVLVTLASFVLFGERFGRQFLVGLTLAIAGAIVLLGNSLSLSPEHAAGDALGMLTAVFYAGYIISVSRGRRDGSAVRVMLWTTVISASLLGPVALWLEPDALLPQTGRGWLVLIALAVGAHVGGQGLIAWALAHLQAAFSSVSLLVQPVAAAAFAWWILAEPFGAWQAAGGATVLMGILLCRSAQRRRVIDLPDGGEIKPPFGKSSP